MHAVEASSDWELTARVSGEPVKTVAARELMREIADAAWRCADPGVQYDTTINRWHTCPESGRINASNPCSEYMHVDDSACNLASINLMKFRREDGSFDVRALRARRRRRLPGAGDRRHPVELPDRADRRQRSRVPPARPGLREPRRPADGRRHPLRLRRGPQRRRGDHCAHDRPRLPQVGRGRRGGRSVRRVREEPRAAQQRDAHAPRGRLRDRRPPGSRATCSTRPAKPGTRRSSSATSTATATPRRPCSPPPGRSAS